MDFKQSVTTCLKKYVEFNGRAGRPEFWWFALACLVAGLVVGLVSDMLAMLVNLALLLPSLAVGARRLHDMGKSGWFQLLWFIPVLGWAVMIYFLVQPSVGPNQYGEGPALPEGAPALPPGAA
jgi:uncharacterized membrane protein YhaH (DUF805 family)